MSLLIRNGRVITADADYIGDIFIDGEVIKAIGEDLPMKATKEIDATGKFVFHMFIWICLLWEHFPAIIIKPEQERHCSEARQW